MRASLPGRRARRLGCVIARALAAIAFCFCASSTAQTPRPAARPPAPAVAAGSAFEFRGEVPGRRGFEDHVWKFAANGSVRGVTIQRMGGGLGGTSFDVSDSGSWRLEGARLCIEWTAAFRSHSGCYEILTEQGARVRLTGPAALRGTLELSG